MKWQKKLLVAFNTYFRLILLLAAFSCSTSKNNSQINFEQHVYLLPFPKGVSSRIYQGWNSRFSHTQNHQYAVDFLLDKNTPVLAARAGVVSKTQGTFTEGANKQSLLNKANYIIVDHGDGTFAEYFHLAPQSLKVKVGERIEANQHIALSGETGFATVPHLHFMVFKRNLNQEKLSLPVLFESSEGPRTLLKKGGKYSRP